MQISNILNSNPAFQAKVDVSRLGKKGVYFETISRKIKERTVKIPDREIRITPEAITIINTLTGKEGCKINLGKGGINKILDFSEIQIINALIKFLKVSDTISTRLDEVRKLATNYVALDADKNLGVKTYKQFCEHAEKEAKMYAYNETQGDALLKKLRINV